MRIRHNPISRLHVLDFRSYCYHMPHPFWIAIRLRDFNTPGSFLSSLIDGRHQEFIAVRFNGSHSHLN